MALARELAGRGWNVGLLARRGDLLETLAGELRALGVSAAAHPCDVSDAASLTAAVRACEAALGPVDLAIANAGVSMASSAARFEADAARELFRINVEGTMNLLAAVVPGMVERKQGHFVGIASLAGFRGLPGSGVYSASKAAMIALLEAARVELRSRGVAVTIVNPGFIRTPLTDKNRFPMPFLMDAAPAARKIADAIERRRKVYSFPLPMVIVTRLLRHLPVAIFDRVTLPYARARKKH